MISKELLTEVLYSNSEDELFGIDGIRGNELMFTELCKCEGIEDSLIPYGINIYELAYKCKEWALKNGYSLVSGIFILADDEGDAVFDYFYSCLVNYIKDKDRQQVLNNFKSETEPEAIFKACEWILKDKR